MSLNIIHFIYGRGGGSFLQAQNSVNIKIKGYQGYLNGRFCEWNAYICNCIRSEIIIIIIRSRTN